MYKSPNKAGMEAIDKAMLQKFPNMGIAPAELLKFEQMRDLGDGQKAFSKTVTEILAASVGMAARATSRCGRNRLAVFFGTYRYCRRMNA